MVISAAQFTMRRGKTSGALALIAAVKRQAERDQPGTLVYLVHRIRGSNGRAGRTLFFYEQYRDQKALNAHLNSTSWQAVGKNWSTYFEGKSPKAIKFSTLKRIGAFERAGAIPVAR